MKRLIVLRPAPGASATCAAARELGLDPVSIPLFEVQGVAWQPPVLAEFDGLLLTSGNAVRQAGEGLQHVRGLKAYAVGEATAQAARDAGLDIASTGTSGVERLLDSLEPELKLLQLCGEHRKDLSSARQQITSVPVYRSVELPNPAGLGEIEGQVVLVHSRRAAERLSRLANDIGIDRSGITIAAISADAADGAATGWKLVEHAERPSDSALLALASRLCNNPD